MLKIGTGLGKRRGLISPLLAYGGTGKVVLAARDGTTYASGSTKLYKATDKELTWGASLIDITPDYFTAAYISTTGTLILWTNLGNMWRCPDGATVTQSNTVALGLVLSPLWGGVANDGNTIVASEYATASSEGDRRVITSTDDGITWAITLTKNNPADIAHWHSVTRLSTGYFLLTSGDSNLQVKWFTSPTGAVDTWYEIPGISSVDASSQKYRNLSVVEDTVNKQLIWGSDTQVGAAIYKMPTRNIATLVNLLGSYGELLVDTNADGIADMLGTVGATGSLAAGVQTITATAAVSEHYTQFTATMFSEAPAAGDIIYYAGVLRAPNCRGKILLFSKKADGAYESASVTSVANLGDFTFFSVELPVTSINATPIVYIRQAALQAIPGATNYAGNGEYIQFQNLAYINKTKCFGAGNEPSKAEMDAVMVGKSTFLTSQYEVLSPIKIYDLPHACWGLAKGATEYVAVTSCETGDVDLDATIHTSKDSVRWQLDKKWRRRTDGAITYGGFRSARYLATHNKYLFNIQYLENTTTLPDPNKIYTITAVPK